MPSFGEELKRERELRQITLREISEATKINLRYLDALERNDFTHLPGGVFNKGFVRAYAQFVGIDPEVMVNAYLLEVRGQGAADPATEAAGAPLKRRASMGRRVLSLLLLLACLGAVAGLVVFWLRSHHGEVALPHTNAIGAVARADDARRPT